MPMSHIHGITPQFLLESKLHRDKMGGAERPCQLETEEKAYGVGISLAKAEGVFARRHDVLHWENSKTFCADEGSLEFDLDRNFGQLLLWTA